MVKNNDFWENLAQKTTKKAISSNDPNLDMLEREFIKKYLKKTMTVLDVGSGDGLASMEFAPKVKKIVGIEPAPSVVKIAQENQKKAKVKNVEWIQGSALEIGKLFSDQKYDCIISKRCLVNILSWPEQKKALGLISEALTKGGWFLLAEGFTDGLKNLNRIRKDNGLETDKVVDFNLYFEREKFESEIKKDFQIVEKNNFGLYYFLSHFFYPYMIAPLEPKYRSKINQMAAKLSLNEKLMEEYGYISFYALKKK